MNGSLEISLPSFTHWRMYAFAMRLQFASHGREFFSEFFFCVRSPSGLRPVS